MTMRIRQMTGEDQDRVTQIVDELWGHNKLIRSQYELHRADWVETRALLRTTVVVENSDAIVGVGTIFESSLHPAMYIALVNVRRSWQRRGVGAALYNHLADLASDKPWMIKVCDGDTQSVTFLEKRGFQYATSSFIGVIDPRQPTAAMWLQEFPESPAGFHVVSDRERPEGLTRLDLGTMLYRVYAQYHQWNPPGKWPEERIEEVFLGPNTIAGSELWAMDGERPIGAAVLFREDKYSRPDEAHLVHVGVVGQDFERERVLTAQLIRRELEIAAEMGLRVRFEADDEYRPHRALYEASPAREMNRDLQVMVGNPNRREPLI